MSTKRHLGMLLGVNNVHNHNVTHARARNSLPLAHLPASPHSRSHAARPRVVTRRRTHGALYHVEVRAARARLPAPSSLDSRSSRSCRRGCRPQPLSGSNRAEADRTRSSERPPHGSTRGRPVVAHQLSRCRVDSLTSVHARAVHMSMGTTAFDSSDAVVGVTWRRTSGRKRHAGDAFLPVGGAPRTERSSIGGGHGDAYQR